MYYFIVNPNSRSGAGRSIWDMLRRELILRNVPHEGFLTEYVGHAVKLAEAISRKGTQSNPVTIIIVGGDGTINEVLTGLTDLSAVILGYIPTGSGNDFCRGMNYPQDPRKALDCILAKKRIRDMDVPYVIYHNHKYRFGISIGLGYDAAVCQEVVVSPAKKILNRLGLGKLVYTFVALKQLLFATPAPMELTLDGNRKYTYKNVFFTAVMNQKYEGGGFMFCPDAKPDDGVLDVIAVDGMNKLKVLLCLPIAYFGRHTHFKCVHLLRCTSVRINSSLPLAFHRDGEASGVQDEIFVSLEKNTLKIIAPVI